MNDTRCTFECVNLITVHRFTGESFFMPKRSFYYAKKSISKNGVRIYYCCNHRSRLRILQPLCYSWQYVYADYGRIRCACRYQQNGRCSRFRKTVPIWAVVLIVFVLAYALENLLGTPLSFRFACKNFDPKTTHPVLFETTIISATVAIMCPAMSFITAFLYYNYQAGFNMWTLLADWLKLVCFNFPFAFFTQLFFIQPTVRTIFKTLFAKDIKSLKNHEEKEKITN